MKEFKNILVIDAPNIGRKELECMLNHTEELHIFGNIEDTKKELDVDDMVFHELDLKKLEDEIEDAEALVLGRTKLTKDMVERAKKLKLITVHATGFDVVPEVPNGVTVTFVPGYATIAVAEFVVGEILNLFRNFDNMDIQARKANFNPLMHNGHEISGKTVGIVGLGRIGGEVAKMLRGFDCKLLYHDIIVRKDLERTLGIKKVSLEELTKKSDIITIHVMLTPETRNIIDRSLIQKIKKGSVIINASRAGTIDDEALIERLKKKDSFAILDVFDMKLLDEFKRLDNVKLSPHVAFNTHESRKRKAEIFINNFEGFLKGQRGEKINEVINNGKLL